MEYFNEALAVELESVGHPLLAEVYRECKGIPNVCFKRCDHVIVGMQRAKRDNVMRHVEDKRYAKFRTEYISQVMFLYDTVKKQTLDKHHHCWGTSWIWYEHGKPVQPNGYHPDIDKTCAPGIHFFLTLEAALCYDPEECSCFFSNDNGQCRFDVPPTLNRIARYTDFFPPM